MTETTKTLITACGSPGSAILIQALRGDPNYPVELTGVDMDPTAIGAYMIDDFETVPRASDPAFIDRLGDVIEKASPRVVLPQSSAEIATIAEHRDHLATRGGSRILVDSVETVTGLENKWNLAQVLRDDGADYIPETIPCHTGAEIRAAAAELGFPGRKVCVKPADAKGTRGFRVFCTPAERAEAVMSGRPDDPRLTIDEFCAAFDAFPGDHPVLVMEFVAGLECTVDVYCEQGRILAGFVKTREGMRNGLAMHFEIVDRPDLWKATTEIVERFDCNFFLNVQFKGTKLLEVNPRVSTFVFGPKFNLPLLGVLHGAGRLSSAQVAGVADPPIGAFVRRYYHQTQPGFDPSYFEIPV